MNTILFVRHGKDKKGKYQHDERLTESAKEDIADFVEEMVSLHGYPDIIYYSPFMRCRATTRYILRKLKEMDKMPSKVKCEPKLGRFFTNYERKHPEVHESTLKRNAIIDDDKREFHRRIKHHLKKVKRKSESNLNIWNITHTLVLLHVAEINSINRNPHVEYLDYVKV